MSSSLRDDLIVLSRAIHAAPELAYQERQAVATIAAAASRARSRSSRRISLSSSPGSYSLGSTGAVGGPA